MTIVGQISPNLEDYIEAIFELSQNTKKVRAIDVADKKNVSKASVNNALKRLVQEDLIEHKTYGKIRLTEKGLKLARKLDARHGIISQFLQDVIDVEPEIANADACVIEHHVHKETIDKIIKFTQSIDSTLNHIPPGKRCKIKKIKLKGPAKQRLLEMGIHTGETVKVERIAPLGDPIDIKIKRYHLSLRKKDAANIEVEEL